jgi:hypothetical protein
MIKTIRRWYEDKHLYRANPCDRDGSRYLKPLNDYFTALGSECRCCSGARVAAAVALVTWVPYGLWLFVAGSAGFIIGRTIHHLTKPENGRD